MLGGAYNTAGWFLFTNRTLPHTRRICGNGLSDRSNFRLVHSGFCQHKAYSPYAVMNPRPITHGHLWLVFALPSFTSCKAGVSSRLQRAVSVAGIASRFLQRSIRGSVSRRYPIIPLLGISVRKAMPFRHFYLFAGLLPRRVYMRQRVAARWNSSI